MKRGCGLLCGAWLQGDEGYRVMRSTRLPLGGVILSGKKLTSMSNSCVRWAYV